MKGLRLLAVLLGLAAPALAAGSYTLGPVISTNTGTMRQGIAGVYTLAPSSAQIAAPTIVLDGVSGSVAGTSGTFNGTGMWTLTSSSGIRALAGGIYAPFFSGTLYGAVAGNAATASSATNIAGGAANSLPYQSAANTTAMLAQGTGVLQETAGAPGWTLTPTLTGTNFTAVPWSGLTGFPSACTLPNVVTAVGGTLTCSQPSNVTGSAASLAGGAANSLPYQSGANTTAMLATGTGVLTASGGAPAWNASPSLTGTNFTAIPESGISNLASDLASKASTGTSVAFSTIVVTQDGAAAVAIPNTPIYAVGSPNADWQLAIQNKNAGNAANTGFFALADNGTNSTNGAWFGINGSGYSGSVNGWFDGPDDGLAYALSGNMGIGAAASGKVVNIFAGGNAASNVVAVMSSTGTSIIPSGFSVGRSSFSVAGGTATVAYGLVAQNLQERSQGAGCAQFDASGNLTSIGTSCGSGTGTVSTTAGAAAGGTARFTGALTVSTGAFTDNGTTVTAPSGSALILLGTSNVETFLSSQAFSAAGSFTVGVTVLSSSTVHCVANVIQNTSNGYPQITFNADTTAGHYSYVGVGESIGGAINSGTNSSSNIPPLNLVQVPTVGSHYSFNVEYNTSFTDETQIYGGGMQLNGNWAMNTYAGRWTSGPPTTMTVTPSAGTMTGYIKCSKLAY